MAPKKPDPLSVLFIGNSYTYCNRLPIMLEKLSAAGDVADVRTELVAPGGCTFRRHWRLTGARSAIRRGGWDYVALQDHSLAAIRRPEVMRRYSRLFAERVRAAGAKPIFYMTWARQWAPEMQDTITLGYTCAARETKALVAPVGEAWKLAFARRKGLVLHVADRSHPNPAGTYLAACVFYAVIHGKSPLGLPGRLTFTNEKRSRRTLVNLTKPDAAFLQRVAWETVRPRKRS